MSNAVGSSDHSVVMVPDSMSAALVLLVVFSLSVDTGPDGCHFDEQTCHARMMTVMMVVMVMRRV